MIRGLQQRIGSANWNNWQMTRWCFYDYVRLTNSGVTNLDFFSVPVGGVDPVSSAAKTHEQTNLTKVRTFGQVYFVVQQIRTHIHLLPKQRQNLGATKTFTITANYAPVMHRLYDLLNLGVLQIKIGQKEYFDIPQPFRLCPPGFGVSVKELGFVGGALATDNNFWFQQTADSAEIYNLSPPQLVEPEQNIEAKITFDDAASPTIPNTGTVTADNAFAPRVDIGLILEGYIIRPAQ